MVRGGIALALCASLGGCHLLFGHSPSGAAGGDGRPAGEGGRLDVRRERTLADLGPADRPPEPGDGGPSCPVASWCPDPTQQPISADLYDLSGTDDASVVYIAGDGVVLRATSAQRVWQLVAGLPVAVWRGVHALPTGEAIVVGNDKNGQAVAFRIPMTGSPTKIEVENAIQDHALNGVWTDEVGRGQVATAAKSYGGSLAVLDTTLKPGPSFGVPILAVDGTGPEIWAVGEKGWLGTLDNGWVTTALSGSPTLRGTVALGLELACAAGVTGSVGYVACCSYLLQTLNCPYTETLPAVTGIGPLRDITTAGPTIVAVGDKGLIASAGLSLSPLKVHGFSKEAAPTQATLRSVWGAIQPVAGKYHAWAVGDGGVILHRVY